ncbi:CRISPR-associated RAMP protein, Csm4 family [Methanocaldococcus vulcanius M7]|uniref:CRISPR system Cms protein Csm4 n=1 Tax=Methanocaldococcus vulcanius (strain ATCC 700851 / DSM 12094 / M7) TaxID=579137 RepID=C9RHM9_METVM|nr:type III-A CRISPR-associated RAMP protein Csm4 [Methanocaldococcus vulcanius]ACX73081.1 CRISPR-associated RAMP protein, Csm4 family [Methanocaldococcus vulcanius M7]
MDTKIIKLNFKTPIHVGDFNNLSGQEIPIHSDTIFGAICNALDRLGVDVKDFVKNHGEDFVISSGFPYVKDKLYFPKPLNVDKLISKKFNENANEETYKKLKKFKKMKFFDKKMFEAVINRDEEMIDSILDEIEDEEDYGYKIFDLPKVVLDRVTVDSQIYYLTMARFEEDCGIYFLYRGNKKVFKNYIEPAIRLLEDEGIGGKRSWGLGLFNAKIEDFKLNVPKNGNYYLTLSLMYVDNPKILERWNFVYRKGWIFTRYGKPHRKPLITMISEGSIVKENYSGEIIDLDGFWEISKEVGHKVFVNGRGFLIPIKYGWRK